MARKKSNDPAVAPDVFQQQGVSWVGWLESNVKLVIAAIVVVLAGVIGLEYVQSSGERSSALMTDELVEAVEEYQEATELRKVLTSTSATELNEGYEKARAKLAAFQSEHGGTDAARIASLYEADLLARLGKQAEAETKFAAYVSSAKGDDELLFFALEGLGYAQEAQNELDEAAKTFEQLATSQPFYKDYGLKHKARVLEQKGDKAGAIAAYQSIVDMEPASSLKPYAENRLKALQ
jgi:predicted negative regulator of RcsB-dependent stress response